MLSLPVTKNQEYRQSETYILISSRMKIMDTYQDIFPRLYSSGAFSLMYFVSNLFVQISCGYPRSVSPLKKYPPTDEKSDPLVASILEGYYTKIQDSLKKIIQT